jgi:hypothetical protein
MLDSLKRLSRALMARPLAEMDILVLRIGKRENLGLTLRIKY